MPRYELIFRRDGQADDYLLIDHSNGRMTPKIGGQHLDHGATITRDGETWLCTLEDGATTSTADNLVRFICTPAQPEPR